MSMTQLIKTAALEAIQTSNPVHVCYGEVIKVNPLEVNVDQRFTLTADFLVVPESMTRYEVDLSHAHQYQDDNGTMTIPKASGNAQTTPIVIRTGLQTGDKVVLIRIQGGQKYFILDKVVSA